MPLQRRADGRLRQATPFGSQNRARCI